MRAAAWLEAGTAPMLRTHFAQHHPACHNCAPPGCSYDVEGRRLEKKGRRDRLERHIAKADSLGKVRGALGGSVYIIGMVGCQGMRSAARGKHDSCASSRGAACSASAASTTQPMLL